MNPQDWTGEGHNHSDPPLLRCGVRASRSTLLSFTLGQTLYLKAVQSLMLLDFWELCPKRVWIPSRLELGPLLFTTVVQELNSGIPGH